AAGLITQAQMVALQGVTPAIPLIPSGNPGFLPSNNFRLDLRISRPIKIEDVPKIHKNFNIEPYFDAFNLFNYRGTGGYSGLNNSFGSLNVPARPDQHA